MNPTKLLSKIPTPFSNYTSIEGRSGIILLFCAIAALLIANSEWGHTYFELLETHLAITFGEFALDKPLHIWINDGLMAIFFFYVGLEIKREIMVGELSDFSQAILPFFAAIGGMVIPAGLFVLLHQGQTGIEGWGIPMATDIAFSLGILMLLGERVPTSLKVFLTAFAIVDDIGAILVIALFYSEDVSWLPLAISGGLYVGLLVMNALYVRQAWIYLAIGVIIWYCFLQAGIHPTVAGIMVALAIPSTIKMNVSEFVNDTEHALKKFYKNNIRSLDQFLGRKQINAISTIEDNTDKVQPPLQKLENNLHPTVSYVIMPIFALANAGVVVSGEAGISVFTDLSLHILLGLVVGKVAGIIFFSWLSVKLGLASLPDNTNWTQLTGVGFLGGIGFTMSLFIANLAFAGNPEVIIPAKVGILLGSGIAGITGVLILYFSLPKKVVLPTEHTENQAVIKEKQLT